MQSVREPGRKPNEFVQKNVQYRNKLEFPETNTLSLSFIGPFTAFLRDMGSSPKPNPGVVNTRYRVYSLKTTKELNKISILFPQSIMGIKPWRAQ